MFPRTRVVAVVIVGLLGASSIASATPAGIADDRFDAIAGPLGEFVVRPDDFGLDASRTLVDVPAAMGAVDGARAFSVVEALAFPRTATGPEQAREDAREIVRTELSDAGYDVQLESVVYEATGIDSPNLWAELPGTECAQRTLVIGGHYDSEDPVGGGADDNATGVAAMLEIARALRSTPLPVTVRFASWSYEEVGLVGAFEMAGAMSADGRDVAGAISLEMLGYTEPSIDPLTGLPADYLAMIADPTSADLARGFGAAAYTYTPEFAAAAAVIDPEVLPDILRSDHAAFFANGYPALIATDTANFRNPNYHEPTDVPETLDKDFFTGSIRATLAGLITVASVDDNQNGLADICEPPEPTTETTTSTSAVSTPPATPSPSPAAPVPGQAAYTG